MNRRPALYLAGQGYPIFLCVPGGKKPLTPRGFYDASADPAQVAEWWEKWPDANIGLPTGTITVLDIDPDKGGVASLQRLERDFEPVPPTFKVATGSGGRHHYYLEDATCSIRCSDSRLGPGLDIRGVGGYVLLPPSVTTGRYETLNTLLIAPCRLSKKAGQVLEALLREGGAASIEALVSATKVRRDNLRQRYLRRLEETGIVVLAGEVVRLADNWREKLELACELGGEIDAERADKRRYEIEREMFAKKSIEEGNGNEAN